MDICGSGTCNTRVWNFQQTISTIKFSVVTSNKSITAAKDAMLSCTLPRYNAGLSAATRTTLVQLAGDITYFQVALTFHRGCSTSRCTRATNSKLMAPATARKDSTYLTVPKCCHVELVCHGNPRFWIVAAVLENPKTCSNCKQSLLSPTFLGAYLGNAVSAKLKTLQRPPEHAAHHGDHAQCLFGTCISLIIVATHSKVLVVPSKMCTPVGCSDQFLYAY